MGRESEVLKSCPFKNHLNASLKVKQWKTGNLAARVTRTEKSALMNAIKTIN
jgi:hypothetical protein